MDRRDLKEGQEVYVKGRVIHTGDHLDIVLDKGSFIENAIILHHEKPVIQQFVADWYENYKDEFEYYLKGFISKVDYHINHNTKNQFYKWLGNPYNDPILTLVNMHQFGYEVEKKKLYTAKLKIITNGDNNYLNKYSDTERFTLSNLYTASGAYQTSFSRSELEQLNVWDNPVFEIKEADNEMD